MFFDACDGIAGCAVAAAESILSDQYASKTTLAVPLYEPMAGGREQAEVTTLSAALATAAMTDLCTLTVPLSAQFRAPWRSTWTPEQAATDWSLLHINVRHPHRRR